MTISKTGIAAGAVIALAVPVAERVVVLLLENGVIGADETRPILSIFGPLVWISLLVLGPVGIAVIGWSLGIRRWFAWLSWLLASTPPFLIAWFLSAATLSGALGNPF
jgi:hypothetical protein